MPSNKDLIEDILAIDPEAKTEGLKNDQLAAMLKESRAKQYVASKQPEIAKTAQVGAALIDVLTQGKGLQLSAPEEDAPFEKADPPKAEDVQFKEGISQDRTTELPQLMPGDPVPLERTAEVLTPLDESTARHLAEAIKNVEYPATKIDTYHVAEGKAITSKRGVLGPGEGVRAEYFVGGKETLQSLKKQGMIK